MPKKKSSRSPRKATPPRRVIDGLYEAEELLEGGQPAKAARLLEEFDRRHPGFVPVLETLADAYYELQDMHGYEWACYRLLQVDDSNVDAALALGGAYIANFRPALAIRVLEYILRRWPDHERAAEARQTLDQLYIGLHSEMEELGLAEAEALELAVLNEQVRLFLEHGRLPQGKQVAEKLLKSYPDFVPAINNLSQIYAQQGDTRRAIELCRRVLAIEPDNVHALSNLTRMSFVSGQPEEAAAMAERLKASQAPAIDFWTKKAEAFSILGDDRAVLDLYEQAKKAGALKPPEASPLFLHLAAVAHWNQGKEIEARRLWQRALDLQPGFELAQQQLDDLKQPPGHRCGPWGMPLAVWITGGTIRELSNTLEKAARRKQDSAVQAAAGQFLDRHPELIFLAPHMLQRSDPLSIDFAINLAGMSHHPDLLAALEEFIRGQRGRDKQRMNAAQALSEAGLLPSGTTRMWMAGEWRDILFLSFEITPEPDSPNFSSEVQQLYEEAYDALQDDEPQKAQRLLEQAVALEPDSPSLLNNLAKAFDMQGEEEKAHAMLQDIHRRFPDYTFGIISMAHMAMQVGDVDKARDLLNGLMQRKRLHYSEYEVLCMAQIELCLAEKNKDAARSWFETWERVDPENPKLEMYRLRVGLVDTAAMFEKLMRRKKGRKG